LRAIKANAGAAYLALAFFIGGVMAWTSTDITNLENAIRSIATSEVSEVEINGRRYKKQNIMEMYNLLELMKADLGSQNYGGAYNIEFTGVID